MGASPLKALDNRRIYRTRRLPISAHSLHLVSLASPRPVFLFDGQDWDDGGKFRGAFTSVLKATLSAVTVRTVVYTAYNSTA